jgi:hypothetical protein
MESSNEARGYPGGHLKAGSGSCWMKAATTAIRLCGVALIIAAIIINPAFTLKPTVSYVEFVNLTFIKIYIVILELLLFLLGAVCIFRPGRVASKIKGISPANLYRRKAEISLLLMSFLLCLIVLEMFSRFLFANANNLPFNYKRAEMVYPALYTIKKNFVAGDTNVLLLGGSVLYNSFDTLSRGGADCELTFHNAAYIAHTSLDSLYKYKYLSENGYKFDYIVFYHGINDLRLNNIPPEYFKNDYSHYYYYKLHGHLFGGKWSVYDLFTASTLAYNAYQLFFKVYSLTTFRTNSFIPYDIPVSTLTKYGIDIKSEATFSDNLSGIIELSKSDNSTLVVPLFATEKDFADTELTRIWGEPENVIKGIARHNNVISRLQQDFVLIETKGISADKSNFEDICHYTQQGRFKFGALIVHTICPPSRLYD